MISSRGIATGAALIFAVACATGGSTANDSGKIIQPKMVSRAPMPTMHFTGGSSMVPLAADIDVVIDSTGVPVMSTFRASGSAVTGNRDALYQWIEASTFQPGLRDGQPIAAVFHTKMQFRLAR